MGKIDEKMEETKNLGLGKRNSKHSYHVSEDIKLEDLKSHAKSLGVSIGELFNSAAVVAHTKLDVPAARKASKLNTLQAVSCHD